MYFYSGVGMKMRMKVKMKKKMKILMRMKVKHQLLRMLKMNLLKIYPAVNEARKQTYRKS